MLIQTDIRDRSEGKREIKVNDEFPIVIKNSMIIYDQVSRQQLKLNVN